MNKFTKERNHSLSQENCNHPFTVVCSLDTTYDEWERTPNHICPFCHKTFFNYYDELKILYENKKLIGKEKLDGLDGKTFTIPDLKTNNIDKLNYIKNLYLKIDEIINIIEGPCIPNTIEVLFDYISLNQKEKVFTKLYKNVK